MSSFSDDIFISYSHLDNLPVIHTHKGWVEVLHERLEIRISQLTGRRIRIWRDLKLSGNDYFSEALISRLSTSAILLCILSPSYVKSDWCLKELHEFYKCATRNRGILVNDKSRIFKILKTPIPYGQHPNILQSMLGYEFYGRDQVSGKVREFHSEMGQDYDVRYWERFEDLAHDIGDIIGDIESYWTSTEPQSTDLKPPIISTTGSTEFSRSLRVFLCHSSSDKPAVRNLYHRLRSDGIEPWLDEEDLLPGQDWSHEIPRAVRRSDVVIICLSNASINKGGFVQKEIKYALDVAYEQPEGTVFLIPVKLEECDVPDRLRHLHWVNIFEETGYKRLMKALRARAGTLNMITGAEK